MSVVLGIVKRFLYSLVRDRSQVLYMLVLPVIFTFLFGVLPNLASGSSLPIAVVDNDRTAVSNGLLKAMERSTNFKVKVVTQSRVMETMRLMETAVAVTLPKGLQQEVLEQRPLQIELTTSPNGTGDASGAVDAVSRVKSQLELWTTAGSVAERKAIASGVHQPAELVKRYVAGLSGAAQIKSLVSSQGQLISDTGVVQRQLDQAHRALIGFTTMFIVFTLFGATGTLFHEKESGTWARMKSAPASRAAVMAGYGLGYFLMGWVQFVLLYAVGKFLFRIDLPMNTWIIVTTSLYILAVSGIALCVAGMVKTIQQHMSLSSFVAVVSSMIGGAYWPVEVEPTWMQHVAWLVPQNWAMNAYKLIAVGGVTYHALAVPLLVLCGFAAAFFTAGMVQLKYA